VKLRKIKKINLNIILYLLYSLEMSRPGFAYEGYRWENGWPAERDEATETSAQADVADRALVKDNTAVDTNLAEGTMDTAQVVSIQAQHDHTLQASESAGSTAGYSQVSDAEEESDEDEHVEPGQVSLGSAYAQCKAAREAANRRTVVDISCNENATISSTIGGDRVGSMDKGIDKSIENCFKGAALRRMVCWSTSTCHVLLIRPLLFAFHAKMSTSFWKGGRELSVTA
jgi:hypothetical protein